MDNCYHALTEIRNVKDKNMEECTTRVPMYAHHFRKKSCHYFLNGTVILGLFMCVNLLSGKDPNTFHRTDSLIRARLRPSVRSTFHIWVFFMSPGSRSTLCEGPRHMEMDIEYSRLPPPVCKGTAVTGVGKAGLNEHDKLV